MVMKEARFGDWGATRAGSGPVDARRDWAEEDVRRLNVLTLPRGTWVSRCRSKTRQEGPKKSNATPSSFALGATTRRRKSMGGIGMDLVAAWRLVGRLGGEMSRNSVPKQRTAIVFFIITAFFEISVATPPSDTFPSGECRIRSRSFCRQSNRAHWVARITLRRILWSRAGCAGLRQRQRERTPLTPRSVVRKRLDTEFEARFGCRETRL